MRHKADREQGASLVEFALILPVFMALVLGMFTGGLAYNRKISMTNAAREASRYGATLSVAAGGGTLTAWLTRLADVTETNASGDLDAGVAGRNICVAYVYPDGGGAANDGTHRLVRTTSDALSGVACFPDGRPNSERRVQVQVERTSPLEALFFTVDLTLRAKSVTLFEATP